MKLYLSFILFLILFSGCERIVSLPNSSANTTLSIVTVALQSGPNSVPEVTEDQAKAAVETASDLWAEHCGIEFEHRAHYVFDAMEQGISNNPTGDKAILKVQQNFALKNYITVVFISSLSPNSITTDGYTGGISSFPWDPRKAILLSSSSSSIAGPLLAHELGHFLGLLHTDPKDPTNLMSPLMIGLTDPKLIQLQCDRALEYLLSNQNLQTLCRPNASNASKLCSTPVFGE